MIPELRAGAPVLDDAKQVEDIDDSVVVDVTKGTGVLPLGDHGQ